MVKTQIYRIYPSGTFPSFLAELPFLTWLCHHHHHLHLIMITMTRRSTTSCTRRAAPMEARLEAFQTALRSPTDHQQEQPLKFLSFCTLIVTFEKKSLWYFCHFASSLALVPIFAIFFLLTSWKLSAARSAHTRGTGDPLRPGEGENYPEWKSLVLATPRVHVVQK